MEREGEVVGRQEHDVIMVAAGAAAGPRLLLLLHQPNDGRLVSYFPPAGLLSSELLERGSSLAFWSVLLLCVSGEKCFVYSDIYIWRRNSEGFRFESSRMLKYL